MKVIDVRWFASRDCIGIVQIVQEHELQEYKQTGNANFKYYIGVGWGENEKTDSSYIAEHGTPFDATAGDALFRVIKNDVPV
jgi:hypothetical protein